MMSMEIWKSVIQQRKELIVFHNMIADTKSNKKVTPIVTELFLRGRKLTRYLVFISHSCFKMPKIYVILS